MASILFACATVLRYVDSVSVATGELRYVQENAVFWIISSVVFLFASWLFFLGLHKFVNFGEDMLQVFKAAVLKPANDEP